MVGYVSINQTVPFHYEPTFVPKFAQFYHLLA